MTTPVPSRPSSRSTSRRPVAASQFSTIAEIARRLDCSIATIRRRIGTGALRVVRDGRLVRVAEEDFQQFLHAAGRDR